MMNVAFIIPTGMGCKIGGHAGDATPAARLIGQVCDKLILHPNVVNASDINEMPENALYVEGSHLDRFLEGVISLREVHSNKILVVTNAPAKAETINAVNAAKATLGIKAEILELAQPLLMEGWIEDGVATGSHKGVTALIDQVHWRDFDALAIATPIKVDKAVAIDYFKNPEARVNPWGAIEATVSRQIATALAKPVAHAPVAAAMEDEDPEMLKLVENCVVDPRKAAEVVSNCFLHCVLKGLHKSPRVNGPFGIQRDSLACLVTPTGLVGRPHEACFKAGIPVIAVKENTCAKTEMSPDIIYVENYLEAAGLIACMRGGIEPNSVLAGGYYGCVSKS